MPAAFDRQLPAHERRRHGQFYTPRPVADLLAALTLRGEAPSVLDPGCGDGECLLAARAHSPRAILHGFEQNPEAAARAAARLPAAHIVTTDFFARAPSTPRHDCLLGNPPYVRSQHREVPGDPRFAGLAAKTDLFAYFIVHALSFLAVGGRLGFVTPASWLTARYAAPLQALLTRELRLELLVAASPRAKFFADPAIHTLLLVARRVDPDSPDPPDAALRLVTLRRPLADLPPPGRLADELLARDHDHEDDRLTLKLLPLAPERAALAADPDTPRNWSYALRAPLSGRLFDRSPAFVPLEDLARVALGYKSLQNDFYYLTPETIAAHAVEPRYLTPISMLADLDGARWLQAPRPRHHVFLCRDAAPAPGAAAYIAHCADRPAAQRKQSSRPRTIREALAAQGGGLWYAPKARPHAAHIWLRKAFDATLAPFIAPEPVVVDQRCNSVTPGPGLSWQLLAAVLTATPFALALELHGAASLGAGALEAATTSLRRYPVFDPRPLDASARAELVRLAAAVWQHERPLDWSADPRPGPALRALDGFILARCGGLAHDRLYRDLHATCLARVTRPAETKRLATRAKTHTVAAEDLP